MASRSGMPTVVPRLATSLTVVVRAAEAAAGGVLVPQLLHHLFAAIGQVANVGDHTDHAPRRTELLDRRGDDVERLRVERPEPFVEEHRLEMRRAT